MCAFYLYSNNIDFYDEWLVIICHVFMWNKSNRISEKKWIKKSTNLIKLYNYFHLLLCILYFNGYW